MTAPQRKVYLDEDETDEFHRARTMGRLGVRSAAQLFRACLAP